MTNGLLQANIDVIAGVDNHAPCKSTYENVNNNCRPCGEAPTFICADVSSDDIAEKVSEAGIEDDDDTLIFAGCSPCQYWSKINTSRERSKQSRLLLEHFQDLVDAFRPGYVVIENVSGLRTKRQKSGLAEFLSFLDSAGYGYDEDTVAVYRYGVPQKRHRYLLIATRLAPDDCLPHISLPAPAPKPKRGYPEEMALSNFIGKENGFPSLKAGERLDDPSLHWAAGLSDDNIRRIKMTDHNGGDRSAWRDHPELQIDAYRGKDDIFSDVYGRLWWDQPSSTITTRFHSLSNGRFGHPEEDRALSLREGAVLQTFERTYEFPPSFPEAARQIGNAVPPELARRIGTRIVDHYATVKAEG